MEAYKASKEMARESVEAYKALEECAHDHRMYGSSCYLLGRDEARSKVALKNPKLKLDFLDKPSDDEVVTFEDNANPADGQDARPAT